MIIPHLLPARLNDFTMTRYQPIEIPPAHNPGISLGEPKNESRQKMDILSTLGESIPGETTVNAAARPHQVCK